MNESTAGVFRQELMDVRRLLDSIAQILRDSQLAQAGADRVTAHTRSQLLELIGELNDWTVKVDKQLDAVSQRTTSLEEDHDVHTEALQELRWAAQLSADRLEKLLGIQISADSFPLKRDISEMLHGIRELLGKDKDGEPSPWFYTFMKKIGEAFWVAVGTAALLWLFKALGPLIK